MKERIYKLKKTEGAPLTSLFELLDNADETDLKILIALMMTSDGDGNVEISDTAEWQGALSESVP